MTYTPFKMKGPSLYNTPAKQKRVPKKGTNIDKLMDKATKFEGTKTLTTRSKEGAIEGAITYTSGNKPASSGVGTKSKGGKRVGGAIRPTHKTVTKALRKVGTKVKR